MNATTVNSIIMSPISPTDARGCHTDRLSTVRDETIVPTTVLQNCSGLHRQSARVGHGDSVAGERPTHTDNPGGAGRPSNGSNRISPARARRGGGVLSARCRWPFGVYTRDREAKPGLDSLKQGVSPVQGFLTEPPHGESQLLVLNDIVRAVTGTVQWRAGDTGGSFDVSIEGGERWSGGTVSVPATARTVELELVGETVHAGNSYER